MPSFVANVFGPTGFLPHGQCILWTPGLVWLYAVSDTLITIAYYAIPFALIRFVRERRDLAFNWMFLMFGAFIAACGTTHLLGLLTLWTPLYWLDGGVKAITAALSVATALVLFPLIPKALALPSPAEMDAANQALRQQITERETAQAALQAHARRQAAVAALSQRTLAGTDLDVLMNEAVAVVAQTLDVELSRIMELLPDGQSFVLRTGVGWRPGVVGQATTGAGFHSRAGYTLLADGPVVVEDVLTDTRFRPSSLALEHGVVGGLSVAIHGQHRPYGVLSADATRPRSFAPDEVVFLQAVANLLATAIERAGAEARVRESDERFRLLVAGVRDYAIFMLDLDGRVASWNAGAERIQGYPADEIVGRHVSCFYTADDVERGTPARELATALDQSRFEGEGRRIRKDGTPFWANVLISPVRDATGQLRGFSQVIRDITERRSAQEALADQTRALEAAREELVRKERLAMLGQLAGGVSHELRNPLGVIRNSVYYLSMVLPEDERTRKHLRILEREVTTANGIVTGLLDFARVTPPNQVPTDLNALVRDDLDHAAPTEGVTVHAELTGHLPLLVVDPNQIRLVLGNLILNAVQATPRGGTVTVMTERADEGVRLTVTDTGVGIAAEHLGKIFEPLFTTKPTGIGLGLAVARGLAEANGCRITVASTPGKGSRFSVLFPVTSVGS